MKCLVTGAAGFIGNALAERLVKEGYEVRALLHKTKIDTHDEKIEDVYGDIADFDSIRSYLKDIDFVFHCAAYVKDYGFKKKFYEINLEGTKNIARASEEFGIKRFIYLSHIRYETEKSFSHYSETKALAEQYLMEKHGKDSFPVTIIRPGNVYGPGATTWVLRVLDSIQKNRISLIDHGKGIFLHTYIDNLLDLITSTLKEPETIGEIIDVTDGDNDTTWREYLNDIAKIAGKPAIEKNMSKNTALLIGRFMILLNKVFRIKPWVTPMAVQVFTNNHSVSIEKARNLLNYEPKINYQEGMKRVENWLKDEGLVRI